MKNVTRILSLFLITSLLFGMLSMTAFAADPTSGKCGANLTWKFDKATGALTISGSGAMPEYFDTMTEQCPWGNFRWSIRSVSLPNGLTNIGGGAFTNCIYIKSITIPNSVTSIGTCAFDMCGNLEQLKIGKGVKIIRGNAFSNCSSLKSIVIPDSVTSIESNAFANCSGATSLYISKNLTKLPERAFPGCRSLKSVTIPDAVTSIGRDAFDRCASLRSVRISMNATEIGENAFFGCPQLTNVTIPAKVAKIGNRAFGYYEENLYDADGSYIGSELKKVNGFTVYGCSGTAAETYANGNAFAFVPSLAARFSDAPAQNNWAYKGIEFVVDNGLFFGTTDTTFSPKGAMTRAMLVTVLWRLDGTPKPTTTNTFKDVQNGKFYTTAVTWAAENGIVSGIGNNKFNPNGNVTREQMAAFLYRYAQKKGKDTTARADLSIFPDHGRISSYAVEALSWANAAKLISGTANNGVTLLDPKGNATRAQVASILMRFAQYAS